MTFNDESHSSLCHICIVVIGIVDDPEYFTIAAPTFWVS